MYLYVLRTTEPYSHQYVQLEYFVHVYYLLINIGIHHDALDQISLCVCAINVSVCLCEMHCGYCS